MGSEMIEQRGPLVAHRAARQEWATAANEIAEGLKNYEGRDAAFRAAMAAFESVDPDALAVEQIIKSLWDSPDWSLTTVALACFKAGRDAALNERAIGSCVSASTPGGDRR